MIPTDLYIRLARDRQADFQRRAAHRCLVRLATDGRQQRTPCGSMSTVTSRVRRMIASARRQPITTVPSTAGCCC